MIITCPDCATTYELPPEAIGAQGRLVQCAGCGTSWHEQPELKQTAPDIGAIKPSNDLFFEAEEHATDKDFTSVTEATPVEDPALESAPEQVMAEKEPVLEEIDVKNEAARLARASQSANLAFERNRAERSKALRGWTMLAGCLALLAAPAVAFPQQVTTLFPAAAQLYSKAGVTVNKRGLEFRSINYKRLLDEGVLVLVVEGTIANVSDDIKTIPPLRIALLDEKRQDLYSWTLEVEPGVLKPAGTVKFRSRLGSPPSDTANLQIRFAQPGETTSDS